MIKGLYVHIPFCEKICLYCDFPKLIANKDLQSEYVASLIQELHHYSVLYEKVKTIYIGGGTPSHLSIENLSYLLREISSVIDTSSLIEYTMEANPNDINLEILDILKRHHVNRISLGVQTINADTLKLLHRSHDVQDIERAVRLLETAGFANYNMDFIYSLPSQTMTELDTDLDYIEKVKPAHVSYYSLIIEEKTELMHQIRLGRLEPTDIDVEADMQERVIERLRTMGYERYEISNYSLHGHRSLHNLIYWDLEEYLGIGMAAASQYENKRYVNPRTIKKYIDSIRQETFQRTEEEFDGPMEYLLMGLRKTAGIDGKQFKERFGSEPLALFPQLQKHIDNGLLILEKNMLRFTETGMALSNQVYTDII